MTPGDAARVLAKAAAFDQRTIGEADARAWAEALAEISLEDGLAAVTRHYRDSTERLQAAHVLRHARAIRNERRDRAEVRALPSRFEEDLERDIRIGRGMSDALSVLGTVMAAIEARREPTP